MQVLESPTALPSIPSPFSNKIHSWRAIDFELAAKANQSLWLFARDYKCQLIDFFDDAEQGGPYEIEEGWDEYMDRKIMNEDSGDDGLSDGLSD